MLSKQLGLIQTYIPINIVGILGIPHATLSKIKIQWADLIPQNIYIYIFIWDIQTAFLMFIFSECHKVEPQSPQYI